jgi:hypothetical protein
MDWNEVFQWSLKGFIACCALTLQLTLNLAVVTHSNRPPALPIRAK